MELKNRTVLITGGTSGIGRELAKQLLASGNTVIVTGRDEAKLEATKRALPDVHAFASDVSDPDAIIALHGEVLARFPALDMLVNNAGIMRNVKLAQDRDLQDVTREITTNLSGPVQMIQQFLPHLLSRPTALIVNVSSGLAFIPFQQPRSTARRRPRSILSHCRYGLSSAERGWLWSNWRRPGRRRRCSAASSSAR